MFLRYVNGRWTTVASPLMFGNTPYVQRFASVPGITGAVGAVSASGGHSLRHVIELHGTLG